MTRSSCHACGAGGLETFYEVSNIPVHSCLMMESRDQAVGYQTGDLQLGFCPSCGFIQNTRFDASLHEYSTLYEETQAFSPRFNAFAESLANKLIDRWDMRGKSVVEIGCGKGEFLVLMCELGDCRGIGIDPGYRPERTQSAAADRIEFIQDFWSEKYSHLTGDMVLCRHTLEHIQPVEDFVRLVRRTIPDGKDAVVVFELPDMERILDERAFWDVYYEHCSYFTLGSLARLFRRCGFDVLDLYKEFDGQYLLIETRAGDGTGGERFDVEDDLEKIKRGVAAFGAEVAALTGHWQARLREMHAAGKKAVFWGSGSKAVAFLTTMGIRDEVRYVVDINPHKHGKFLAGTGQEIVGPEFLTRYQPDLVVAMNPIYLEEIGVDCEKLGVQAELVGV